MKQVKTTAFVLTFILLITNLFAQSGTNEQLTVPLSIPGKSYSLKVNLVNGSIKVSGYDGKDIVIDVTTPGSKNKETISDAPNGMKRISALKGYEVTAKEENNNVNVFTGNPERTFYLALKVPQGGKLKLSTVNNGAIEVDNVKGELEVINVNGAIKLTKISGSVVANTVNGDVSAEFITVNPTPMAFSTLNGDINVTLPADIKANLKLKSDHGEVFSDFDIDVDKNPPKVNKTEEPGMYKIKLEDWIYGKLNGGGPEILMKNMEGNIYIKKAAK